MVRAVLVTGANSGIGLETAVHLARLGFRVVGTARSEDKLASLTKAADEAGVAVEGVVLDVTDPEACRNVVASLEPSAVVNNAGYLNLGRVVDVPPEDALRQLDAMVVGPMQLARLAVPSMRRRGGGRIVNISSVSAHTTAAMAGWYQACKHALSAVTDALRREMADDGMDVVLVEPGALGSGIWDKGRDDLVLRSRWSASPTVYRRSLQILRAFRPFLSDPATAAEVIGDALTADRPKAGYRVGVAPMVIDALNLFLPRRLKDRLAWGVLRG